MKKVLFIDRDGTLILEPSDEQVDSFEKLEFYPGVFTWLGRIARELDYELVMVTNQDGLGTDTFPEETFWPVQNLLLKALANEGIRFTEILIDHSRPEENKPTRKPGTGLLSKYTNGSYDLENSFTIGDRITDIELAKNLNSGAILLNNSIAPGVISERKLEGTCKLITTTWEDVYRYLDGIDRAATVKRNTNETQIEVTLKLTGNGKSDIDTGLAFFDHMLEQLARHGNMDLYIKTTGDLNVDEHHTIEDTALALGEAVAKALGDKKGIERYGYCLPMDDCLAQVSLDFGGRPWLVWNANFLREKIGDMPTEMFMHFFKSFSDAARCNLNITAEGTNEHHKIESIFKAFAKSIRMAVRKDGNQLPTTKGVL